MRPTPGPIHSDYRQQAVSGRNTTSPHGSIYTGMWPQVSGTCRYSAATWTHGRSAFTKKCLQGSLSSRLSAGTVLRRRTRAP